MPRSLEQQALVDELIEFLKPYKGKSIDTDVLAKKIEEIWEGKLGDKSPAGKLSDLRRDPTIFEGVKIEYKLKGKGPWNVAWQNDAEWRKFFKEKNPGVKWEDLTTEQRDIKSNTWKSYEVFKERSRVIPKNYIRQNDFADKVGMNRDTLGTIRTRDNYKNLNSELNKYFKPKKFKEEVWFPDPSKKGIEKFKALVKANAEAGTAQMAIKKGSVSNQPILALHKELIRDVDARPWELAENIYGNSKAKTLQMIGNDASKYVEVLRGSRTVPGLVLPSITKIEDILSNILVPGSGFWKFGNSERRNAMLRERDEILKTKGPKLKRVRDYLTKRGVVAGMHLDETLSLAATYEKAPGYTELAQRIPGSVNLLKGNTIDKDFAVLLGKVIDGKEGPGSYREVPFKNLKGHVKLFNEYSKSFQKEWGIDTPTIEYKPGQKLNASHFIKHFDKLSPEAQVNVNQLANKGIVMRSKSVPMREMLFEIYGTAPKNEKAIIETILGCRKAAASGGRIGFAGGTLDACVNTKLKNQTLESGQKIVAGIEEGATGVLGKMRNAATGFLGALGKWGPRIGKYGAIAAAGALAKPAYDMVRQFTNDDPTTYLTDPEQMEKMLLSTIEAERTPKPRSEILDWSHTAGTVGATGAVIPGSRRMYDYRRGLLEAKIPKAGPVSEAGLTAGDYLKKHGKGYGKLRAGAGVGMKLLSGMFTPAGILATEPLRIAQMRREGESWGEVAKSPTLWMGPAFADTMTRIATSGMKPSSRLAKALSLGMSRPMLKTVSRRFGMPGLALSLGLSGYDQYQDYKKKRGFFAKDKD
jgi:hypothetical protein